jgi:PAS domain S-box-containing protein
LPVETPVRSFLRRQFDTANPHMRTPWWRYGIALLCVSCALLATLLVPPVRASTPLLFFFPAIMFSAVYGGFGAGLLAIVLSTLALYLWVLPITRFLQLQNWWLTETLAFQVVSIVLVLLIYALQRARRRLLAESEELHAALAIIAASEERFRVAQELSLDAFTILDSVRDESGNIVDFRWQYVNPAAARLLNSERVQLEGRRLLEVLPGNKANSDLFARYVRVVDTGQPHDIEIAYDADGIQGWFRNMAVRLGDGVAVSFYDITDRKHYERQLSYQAFLLENVSDAVFAFDSDLHITLWNRGAEDLYGWKAEEAIGRPAGEVVRTIATSEEAKAKIAAVDMGLRRHFEVVHHTRAGDLLYIDSTATVVRDEDGSTIGYVVINRDMTARRRYEKELEELNSSLEQRVRERTAELERSNRELDQFAYVASHDLKAPLRAIALLSEWITEDAAPVLPPASLEHLAKLNGRIRRMDTLLDDLLDYSRAGRIREELEWVDTRLLIANVIELLNLPPGFTVTLPDSMPALFTERVPLETVFRNLIQNAFKHHNHPDYGCVTIAAHDQGAAVLFVVTDDGPGIPAEYHDRVFALFQTLRPRDQVEGSGIGLSIVKKTIESRGGTICLESQPGAGASFSFTWPKQGHILPQSKTG